MRWKLWPWPRKPDTSVKNEAKERFEAVVHDDERVDRIVRRSQKLGRENNLGPTVMRALGVQRK